MKENGLMTKLMDTVFTNILMGPNSKDNGMKINKKEKGLKPGLMELNMRETIKEDKKMYIFYLGSWSFQMG